LAGLALAALAQFIAFFLSAGGEGWNAPFLFSVILFAVYPLTLMRMFDIGRTSNRPDVLLLVVGLSADMLLAIGTYSGESRYFARIMSYPAPYAWLALWGLWQGLAVTTIVRRTRLRADRYG
jgi:hypothetical protein